MDGLTVARRRAGLAATLGVVALAVLGYAAFEFTGQVNGHAATLTAGHATGQQTAARHPGAATSTPRAAATATTTSPTPTATATAAPPGQAIVPVSAVAFGPDGTADGDNPQLAGRVLTDPAMGWVTQWYATPEFGDLKQGTGLLLDMGRTVTVTTVKLTLGSPPGTELQVRLGTAPDPSALPVVTTATAGGDTLSLPLTAPARARYVLVWFTRLPPDGAGTYQVLVHQITVQGQP
jgi:hypothetical protein